MKLNQLERNIKSKKSFLCLGLDTDIDKIPKYLLKHSDPVFEFNKILIDELNMKVEEHPVGLLWRELLNI